MNNELVKGNIDIVMLSILLKNDLYGYDIAKIFNQKNNKFKIREGTLYPVDKHLIMAFATIIQFRAGVYL